MRIAGKLAMALLALITIGILALSICLSETASAASTPTPRPIVTKSPALCVITGMVVDPNGKGVSGARVSLYNAIITNGKYVETGLAGVDQNPQKTSGGSNGGIAGLYQFNNVPSGIYVIWVEVGGTKTVSTVKAIGGTTQIGNIVVEATNTPAATQNPSPTDENPLVTPEVTAVPVTDPQSPQEGDGNGAMKSIIAIVVSIQLIACLVVLVLFATKRL